MVIFLGGQLLCACYNGMNLKPAPLYVSRFSYLALSGLIRSQTKPVLARKDYIIHKLKRWKYVYLVEAVILGILVLFPPFHVVYAPGVIIDKGYSFFLNPTYFQDRIVSTVNMHALFVQIGWAVFLGFLYGLLFIKTK